VAVDRRTGGAEDRHAERAAELAAGLQQRGGGARPLRRRVAHREVGELGRHHDHPAGEHAGRGRRQSEGVGAGEREQRETGGADRETAGDEESAKNAPLDELRGDRPGDADEDRRQQAPQRRLQRAPVQDGLEVLGGEDGRSGAGRR
jgi:hypothetical protein